jgi:hypothetical protein
MVQITLTDEQAKLVAALDAVRVPDPRGNVLGHIEPVLTPVMIAELKPRAREPGPRYTGEQVQARLRALEDEWQNTGGFDEACIREFLNRLNARDPGHTRPGADALCW